MLADPLSALGLYLFLPFVIFLIMGVPIAFTLGLSSLTFLLLSGTRIPTTQIASEMFGSLTSFSLLALPMFVLTGELLNRCNLTDKLIALAQTLVGWIRGGLAHVNILTSMFFAGISGSALADSASIGPILIPAMVREKFPRAFSAAVTASSAVIGAIIPPSIPLIIVGSQLQISIGGLFAAGILPGILTGLFLMITAYIICRVKGYGEIHRLQGITPMVTSSFKASPVLAIPLFILGGILFGIVTPTEAGAAAAIYALILGAFFYRTLTTSKLLGALTSTVRVTASALIIVAAAIAFGRILTFHQFPQALVEVVVSLTENRLLLFLVLVIFFLFVGTFMDALANMIILGPMLMPLAVGVLDLHELQYGMFLMYSLLLGIVTPPLGLVLFVVSPIAGVPIERTSVAILPFLFAQILVLALIVFVPEVTLAIPRWAGFVQ